MEKQISFDLSTNRDISNLYFLIFFVCFVYSVCFVIFFFRRNN